ncbi:acetate kinase [Desulfobaculum xiamenense]|uniref:Acetate kinase n=1 Tax=Desulfobaculum xiamenense TaxID=995050 RepID=A0A846QTT7_9BACT|nr:acetate kinase [Desulfobaculum xiamenense]NJB68584.1 acetate kinase [Desulfobaculum xiamenense]
MKILVINSGSSSIKYQLFDMAARSVMASGVVERIGLDMGSLTHKRYPGTPDESKSVFEQPIPDHEVGMELVIEKLIDANIGVIHDTSEIDGVGHRVVHGGEKFTTPMLVDDTVKKGIEEVAPLAPLHNPGHLAGINVAQRLFPNAAHVTVFDTAFHQSIPPHAYHYAVPYELYEELHVRRYGFHGTSHHYVAKRAAQLLGRPLDELNLITVHLGNGSSITAIKKGKSYDTSMGLTPTGGVIMGTRSGNIDPAIIGFLAREKGMDIQQIDDLLTKKAGLQGICGMSDMRDIHAAREKGDVRAQLALDMACHRVRMYIGAYMAELGHVDGVIFTAGIGENDDIVRYNSISGLEEYGIVIDAEANAKRPDEWMRISTDDSRIPVFVIRTNEELEIALQTMDLITRKS